MFEVCHIFVDIASLHFEGEDVPSGEVFAPVILECFGEIVDNRGPNPFICVPSSVGDMLLRYCRNVRPTWVKFDSKDTKESGSVVRGSEY